MSQINIQNLDMIYKIDNVDTKILDDVSLSVNKGEFISIIGPSGCGKSTFIGLIAGLRFPATGQVLVNGREVTGPGPDRGVVFQDYSLFPWMTALENICFGLEQAKAVINKKELAETGLKYLELVGLKEFANAFPNRLSGGMQQRVAIARAFAINSEILLMDEPFGAVDALTRTHLQDLLLNLWEVNKKTVLVVTHDIDEALILSDKILVMSNRPGKIIEVVQVPFARPRSRMELIKEAEYVTIRAKLIQLLHEGMNNSLPNQKDKIVDFGSRRRKVI